MSQKKSPASAAEKKDDASKAAIGSEQFIDLQPPKGPISFLRFMKKNWHIPFFFFVIWLVGSAVIFQQHYQPTHISESDFRYSFSLKALHRVEYIDDVSQKKEVISKGATIFEPDAADLKRLENYQTGLASKHRSLLHALSTFWTEQNIIRLCLLGLLIACFELALFNFHIFQVNMVKRALITGLLLILDFASIALLKHIILQNDHQLILLMCAIPLPLFTVIVHHLLGKRIASCLGIFMAIIFPLQLDFPGLQFQCLYFAIFVTLLGLYSFMNAYRRKDFLLGGLKLGLLFIIAATGYSLNMNNWSTMSWSNYMIVVTASLINGLGTGVLSIAILPVFEWMFGIMTPITLLEISTSNTSLLTRLQREAPGTYQHSQSVCRLAENAAAAINANTYLARAMALYHDIGKLGNPKYFAENLSEGEENPHDAMDPIDSCHALREHVDFGKELARKYKLGRQVLPAIEQHHGNGLMMFFYNKAARKAQSEGSPMPDEKEFRYLESIPSSKEIAIISLADACEAATRSKQNPSSNMESKDISDMVDYVIKAIGDDPQRTNAKIAAELTEIYRRKLHAQLSVSDLTQLIDAIVDAKWRDHQLDNADISTRELAAVKASFVKTLAEMNHIRPEYTPLKDNESRK